MIPDERTCHYFTAIAQEKNISRAARHLYISQPSLSRFLSGLEKEVGGPLFVRNNGTLTFTPAGELFYQYIRDTKDLESRFTSMLSSALMPQPHVLKIGAGSITSPFLVQSIFPILRKEFPDVKLNLIEDVHVNLLSQIMEGKLDLCLLVASGADTVSSRFETVIARSPRLFVIPRTHPLAALVEDPETNSVDNPQLIPVRALENQTLVSGVPGQKVCTDINQLISKYNLHSLSLISSQNIRTNLSMAEYGLAIALLPRVYVPLPETRGKFFYLYSDEPLLQWRMTVHHTNSRLSPVEQRFIDLASAVFSGREPQ